MSKLLEFFKNIIENNTDITKLYFAIISLILVFALYLIADYYDKHEVVLYVLYGIFFIIWAINKLVELYIFLYFFPDEFVVYFLKFLNFCVYWIIYFLNKFKGKNK